MPAVALAATAVAAWWVLGRAPAPPPSSAGADRPPRRPPRAATSAPVLPERNVFEYGETPARPLAPLAVASARPRAIVPVETPSATPAPPEPVRLIGLVNRSGRVRAVLSVLGEVAVVGPGDEVQGYRVIAIEEDRVRLRAPDGTERALARPDGG